MQKMRIYGVITKLHPKHGFIKPNTNEPISGNVYFKKDVLKGGLEMQSMRTVLFRGQCVGADVVPTTRDNAKARWDATSVWLEGDTYSKVVSSIDGDVTRPVVDSSPACDLKQSYECYGDEDAMAASSSCVKRAEGTIKRFSTSEGFIEPASALSSEKGGKCVRFTIDAVMNAPLGKSVQAVLRVGQKVNFDAVPRRGGGGSVKWEATEVWLHRGGDKTTSSSARDPPTNAEDVDRIRTAFESGLSVESTPWIHCEKVKEQNGWIYPVSKTEAKIKCGRLKEPVLAISEVVYVDGRNDIADLKERVQSGSDVVFNAIRDDDCPAQFRWKATVVWVGGGNARRRTIPDAASSRKIWDALRRDYRCTDIVLKKASVTSRKTPPEKLVVNATIGIDDDAFESTDDENSDSETEDKSVKCGAISMCRIKSVQQDSLVVLVGRANIPVVVPSNVIYVNGTRISWTCRHLNEYFARNDMVSVKFGDSVSLGSKCTVALAWLGMEPKVL